MQNIDLVGYSLVLILPGLAVALGALSLLIPRRGARQDAKDTTVVNRAA